MKRTSWLASIVLVAGCIRAPEETSRWQLSEAATGQVDETLARQISMALDAAEHAGTDPSISHYDVRAATVVEAEGREHVVVGSNTEYHIPEAIHGETSLLNHVTSLLGKEATRRVRFLAFYTDGKCGSGSSCGDCRDYQIAVTDYENLLVVCGQGSDHTVHIKRFAEAVVHEESFPEVTVDQIPLAKAMLDRLVQSAIEASESGINLFTASRHHAGAAGISSKGELYRAAGADDAAFHYRYPIGGLLQQAAAESDYFMEAIVVAGERGAWPRVSYRDRQYGYESSSFNLREGLGPILLILTDGEGNYRMTTFEDALPGAFSTRAFMPEVVGEFLDRQAK